ncbi:YgjV family protein [Candidatus Pacearchaeota archaeon]|nr:YgjV family protein [Candidatus Pacearchaeota archaeon]
MIDLTLTFILSQVAMFLAMGLDFLSLQFKKRKQIYLTLVFSASLISAHYFLLGKITAGIIVFFSALRFITCMFTTNKKYLVIFLVLNTLTLIFTYTEIYDFLIYIGLFIFIIGNFQKNDKLMRKQMMIGTSLIILYNLVIFSPMGIIAESSFLIGNFVGYYRHYIKKTSKKKN